MVKSTIVSRSPRNLFRRHSAVLSKTKLPIQLLIIGVSNPFLDSNLSGSYKIRSNSFISKVLKGKRYLSCDPKTLKFFTLKLKVWGSPNLFYSCSRTKLYAMNIYSFLVCHQETTSSFSTKTTNIVLT